MLRGIRGAISVTKNTKDEILQATSQLLQEIVRVNHIQREDVAAIFFTATDDIDAVYPARAARELGWTDTALMCLQEMAVVGSLRHCIRVLVLWNTDFTQKEVNHVYLGEARSLRPDLTNPLEIKEKGDNKENDPKVFQGKTI